MSRDRKESVCSTTKREFREDFHRGTLYNLWGEEDGKGKYLARWARHRIEVVLRILDKHRLGREGWTLDVGLGSGFLLAELERRGGNTVGADFSRSILEAVRTKHRGNGMLASNRLFHADVESLPFRERTFELATCLGVFEYLEDDQNAMAEFYRILRPGGYFILAVASYHRIGGLTKMAIQKFLRRRKVSAGVLPRSEIPLEDRVRTVNPIRLRKEAVRAGFDVVDFKCFGGKILGRYVPIRLFVPRLIYIGDHCVLVLRKSL